MHLAAQAQGWNIDIPIGDILEKPCFRSKYPYIEGDTCMFA